MNDCPLVKLTYHSILEGSPDSVNVALYFTSENAIDFDTEEPFIEKDPNGMDDK